MTAKMDLLAKLTALIPECAGEIAKILHDYEIMPAKVYERSICRGVLTLSWRRSASTAAVPRRWRATVSGSRCSSAGARSLSQKITTG